LKKTKNKQTKKKPTQSKIWNFTVGLFYESWIFSPLASSYT